MALNFPDTPSVNQVYTSGSNSWQWNGTVWNAISSTTVIQSYGPTGPTGTFNTTTQTIDFSESVNALSFTITGLTSSNQSYAIANLVGKTAALQDGSGSVTIAGTITSAESYWNGTIGACGGWNIQSRSADIVMSPPFTNGYTAGYIIGLNLNSFRDNNIYTRLLISGITWDGDVLGATFAVGRTFTVSSLALYHKEDSYVTKTVTGQSWVAADTFITCKCLGLTTADHDAEDAILEGVKFEINNIVAGTGFDIIGHAPEGTYGKYQVKCLGQ